MTIWRKRIACWITKATNTHSEYVILIAFPRQQWLRERAFFLQSMYIARVVFLRWGDSSVSQNIIDINWGSDWKYWVTFLHSSILLYYRIMSYVYCCNLVCICCNLMCICLSHLYLLYLMCICCNLICICLSHLYLLYLMCICCNLMCICLSHLYLLYLVCIGCNLMCICLSHLYLLYLMCICCTMCVLLFLL